MLNIAILFLLVFSTSFALAPSALAQDRKPNRIDKIINDKDIEELLNAVDREQFKDFIIGIPQKSDDPKCMQLISRTKPSGWAKADFNGDGSTDLLVNGRSYEDPQAFILMSRPEGSFSIHGLTRRIFEQ